MAKSDTDAGINEALSADRPTVPEYLTLRDDDKAYFDAIINSRAASTWYESDLCLAVQLAKCLNDLDRIQQQLEVEGYTYNNGDVIKKHPAVEIQDKKIGQVGKLSRALHVHSTAILGRPEATGMKTAAHRQHVENYGGDTDSDNDLFANPDAE